MCNILHRPCSWNDRTNNLIISIVLIILNYHCRMTCFVFRFAGKDNQHAPDKIANNTAMVTNSYNTPSVVADDLSRHLDVMGDSSRQTKGDSCISDQLQFCNNGSQWEKVTVIPIKKDDKNVAIDIDKSHDHSEGGGHHHHATRSIILILALSLHRIFEGMSIGLQDTLTNVASLFVAVMCHEMVIGLSLGLQFVKSQFSFRRLMITSLVCSSIMPVGVLIGLVMTETRSNSSSIDVANGVLQAIAMGTFIYVTFFEILQEEVNPEDTSIAKVVFIAIGFAMMALLILIPEEQLVVHSLVHNVTSAAVESWQVTPPM
jgi:zinc transporter 1/2/3